MYEIMSILKSLLKSFLSNAQMLRLWSMHTKREEMDRQLTQIESEFAQRERSLMLQLAEKDKQISGLTQQIRADGKSYTLRTFT